VTLTASCLWVNDTTSLPNGPSGAANAPSVVVAQLSGPTDERGNGALKQEALLPTRLSALGHWYLKIVLLMTENFAFRHKAKRYSAIIAIAEPLVLIGLLYMMASVLERQARFGTSPALFFASGVLPYSVFMYVSFRIKAIDVGRHLPRVSTFDQIVAHVLAELLLKIVVIVILFAGLYFLTGVSEAIPVDPATCLAALVVLATFGVAAGLINIAISAVFPLWQYLYQYAARILLMFSGAMWVMDLMPPRVQAYMVLDPIAHAIVWFRTGLYRDFPHRLLDLEYMFLVLGFTLVIGAFGQTATREWRNRK
jgi:capsular polysaccharide transport system permease protein